MRSLEFFLKKTFHIKVHAKKLKFHLKPPLPNSKNQEKILHHFTRFTVAICRAPIYAAAETINLFQLFDTGTHSSVIQQKGTELLLGMRQPRFCLAERDCKGLGAWGERTNVALVSLAVDYFFSLFENDDHHRATPWELGGRYEANEYKPARNQRGEGDPTHLLLEQSYI